MGLSPSQKGNHVTTLEQLETIFFDLDGCIWFGDHLADNAEQLVRQLRKNGKNIAFLSNITSSTASLVAARLTSLGIPATESQVMTPFTILQQHPLLQDQKPIYLLGNHIMRSALHDAGLNLTDEPAAAEVVLVSRDTNMTYQQLAEACQALYRGAQLLALNLDARVPVADGVFMPGNGAIVAALTTATGVHADAIGKPSRFFFDRALERFGAARETTAMVGDNLDSDIAGGRDAGLLTIQVGLEDFSQLESPPVPDYRVANLFELQEMFAVKV